MGAAGAVALSVVMYRVRNVRIQLFWQVSLLVPFDVPLLVPLEIIAKLGLVEDDFHARVVLAFLVGVVVGDAHLEAGD